MIWHVLNRVRQAKLIDHVMLAVPEEDNNLPLIAAALSLEVCVAEIGGDPNDLVRRYALVAAKIKSDTIVRVPGDNPCVDPDEIDRIIEFYHHRNPPLHYLTTNLDRNVLDNGYPGGLGAEVYDTRFIGWLDRNVKEPRLREHPHLWAFENNRIVTCPWPYQPRRPELRFDVNTQSDFDFIAEVYQTLYPANPNFRIRDILNYLDNKKEVRIG